MFPKVNKIKKSPDLGRVITVLTENKRFYKANSKKKKYRKYAKWKCHHPAPSAIFHKKGKKKKKKSFLAGNLAHLLLKMCVRTTRCIHLIYMFVSPPHPTPQFLGRSLFWFSFSDFSEEKKNSFFLWRFTSLECFLGLGTKQHFFFFLVLSSGWLASYVGQSEVPALITSFFFCLGSDQMG